MKAKLIKEVDDSVDDVEGAASDEQTTLSPGFLGLIALLSIGGLLFLGWQANLIGDVTQPAYHLCCSTQNWMTAPTGWVQGNVQTATTYCGVDENPATCCVRSRAPQSVRVLGFREGSCNVAPPERVYPIFAQGQAPAAPPAACCTVQTWLQSSTGYTQGQAQTGTAYCNDGETPGQCCLREANQNSNQPVKLLGARAGSCAPGVPELSYPVWLG